MSRTDFYILIHKSLSGEINEGEEKLLSSWLNENPQNKKILDEFRMIWDASLDTEEFNQPDETHIQQQKERLTINIDKAKRNELSRYQMAIFYRNAIIIALLVVSTFFITSYIAQSHLNRPVSILSDNNQTVVLPDSSIVSLNKDSKLTFTQTWNKRTINFQGEGFFKVTENKAKPFHIKLPNGSIKVLGTSFFVRAYAMDTTEVWVSSGRVEVSSKNKKVILYSGENSLWLKSTDTITKSTVEDPNFNSWYTGKLQFEKTKFKKIIKLLEGQYHIKFKVSDPHLLACRFTGTFEDEALDTILKVLSHSMGFSFRLHDGVYLIEGKGCSNSK